MGTTGELQLGQFLRELAAPTPAPGAGGALATTAAMAASLAQMTAQISADRGGGDLDDKQLEQIVSRAGELAAEAVGLGDADAVAYGAVIEAMRMDTDDPARAERVRSALSLAAEPPLRLAALGADVAELASKVVIGGRSSVRGDAIAGVLLAESACAGASALVAIDIAASDPRVAQAAAEADRAAAARSDALSVRS
jgi:formiminotetrahydrofolate cyclodeaminase